MSHGSPDPHASPAALNDARLHKLLQQTKALREEVAAEAQGAAHVLADRDPRVHLTLQNLLHYLALRRRDIRGLQDELAHTGLSSLGRAEGHVLASIDAVLDVLDRLLGTTTARTAVATSPCFDDGAALLNASTTALLGPAPAHREARIMVTLSPDAAKEDGLVRSLCASGMDLVRVNCAHDDADGWERLIRHVRAEAAAVGRPVRIAMDLAGPKLRTGAILAGAEDGCVRVSPGSTLLLTATDGADSVERSGLAGDWSEPVMACTLPEVVRALREGEPIFFDDGKVGGRVTAVGRDAVRIVVTQAKTRGSRVGRDKGINVPDTRLSLPALTAKDLSDIPFVARHADVVELSFAQSREDVRALEDGLQSVGASRLGVVLKIETRRGFDHLPEMLLDALGRRPLGVMIARGDLAIECGYERLAELQEEILWLCEAAHVPVVWATQVLEHLAKKGTPTRAEITDAAMAERAECVMLNKGPHVLAAVSTLDGILRRMEGHQRKKTPTLRSLGVVGVAR